LERQGVSRIAVVRLFLSGDSFLLRTEKILGVVPGAGPKAELAVGDPKDALEVHHSSAGSHAHHGAMAGYPHVARGTHGGGAHAHHMDPDLMPLWRVTAKSTFTVSRQGLLEAGLGPAIMAKRAKALSKDPKSESVLLVAHGVGDDKADQRWRAAMKPAVEAVKKAAAFRKVHAVTLRDDWPEAHAKAVAEIRAFVAEAKKGGGKALVVPYRLYGFGPQSSSLDGLDIVTDDKGLLPDPSVGAWLLAESDRLIKEAGW
jgi:type III secretion system FlhB-like substrate exporter